MGFCLWLPSLGMNGPREAGYSVRVLSLVFALFLWFGGGYSSALSINESLSLASSQGSQESLSSPPLRLLRGNFFPEKQNREKLSSLGAMPSSYWVVQCKGPILPEWRSTLEEAGAEILRYLPDYAYLVRFPPQKVQILSYLPFVRWVVPWLPSWKVSPSLDKKQGFLSAYVEVLDPSAVEGVIQACSLLNLTVQRVQGSRVRVWGLPREIRALANIPAVEWIEPAPTALRLMNDRSRSILGVNSVWVDVGLYGRGQIVTITDSGLATGRMETLPADFRGRVKEVFDLSGGGNWSDVVGHGTHIAGIIAGSGVLSGANPSIHQFRNSFAGVAPEANLIIQAVRAEEVDPAKQGLPDVLTDLFLTPYRLGSRIHNNSWGDDAVDLGVYSLRSRDVDAFIWEHPDNLVLFAVGNGGKDGVSYSQGPLLPQTFGVSEPDGIVDLGSIYAPATAKNCVSVGATEGYRPPIENWGGFSQTTWFLFGFTADPLASDYISDNSRGMAAFSSRGPTLDGRIKPEVVAPGTNIISTRSPLANNGNYWGLYDQNYAYSGGTSQACAFVSGVSALVREWFQRFFKINPSAALMKATLINGAVELSPGQYGTGPQQEIGPRPNPVEGWGRVDIANTLAPPPPITRVFIEERQGLSTTESREYDFTVTNSEVPLVITLAWTDYPASPASARALVNDLDLVVLTPNGLLFQGNRREDRVNNVETLELQVPPPGRYKISVTGFNVPLGPQPFALVVSGALAGVKPLPRKGDVNGDGQITVVDAVLALRIALGFIQPDVEMKWRADIAPPGGDNRVSLVDAVAIVRRMLNLFNPFVSEEDNSVFIASRLMQEKTPSPSLF